MRWRHDLKIGEGRWKGSNYESENLHRGTQNIFITNVKCITEQKEGLQYMYPNGFNTEILPTEQFWREQIRKLTSGIISFNA